MELEIFFQALTNILDLTTLVFLSFGIILGIIFGATPGLTATMGVAILVPLTYGMDTVQGFVVILGMYIGAVYGGSISAILLDIPGTPAAMMTGIDGHKMSTQGEAGRALGIATVSSVVGGLISSIILLLVAPILGRMALKFGYPEYTAIGIFGLTIVAGVTGKSMHKGLLASVLGLMISTVGMCPLTGILRFTYGTVSLYSGISFIPAMIGLFGFRQVLSSFDTKDIFNIKSFVKSKISNIFPTFKDLKVCGITILRCSLIGTFIGALPGAGGSIAAFIAYDTEQKSASDERRKLFGTGIPEGIAAPESSNNAVTGGALIPLLTLGIPGDAATAVMLGAFLMHDLRPGPGLFQHHADIVASIYITLFLANIMLLFFGLYGARIFAKIIEVPQTILMPVVAVFCLLGSFSVFNSYFDVYLMVIFGVLGFILQKFDIPVMPIVLGMILGPIIEINFRQALLANHGNWLIFIQKPISLTVLLLAIVGLFWPFIKNKIIPIIIKKIKKL
jgi:putative tricarboxylic transport membrane protein